MTTVYTIGFTKRRAPEFFGALRNAGIKQLLDVRLNNSSQLAGFTKREDLPFLLQEICGASYRHEMLQVMCRTEASAYVETAGLFAPAVWNASAFETDLRNGKLSRYVVAAAAAERADFPASRMSCFFILL